MSSLGLSNSVAMPENLIHFIRLRKEAETRYFVYNTTLNSWAFVINKQVQSQLVVMLATQVIDNVLNYREKNAKNISGHILKSF